MTAFDDQWAERVCSLCDPVLAAADVGFERQVHTDQSSGRVATILWEADPHQFAAKYPDSDIVDSYGDQWDDVHCIDYWVYVDADDEVCRLSVEGWNLPEILVRATG